MIWKDKQELQGTLRSGMMVKEEHLRRKDSPDRDLEMGERGMEWGMAGRLV